MAGATPAFRIDIILQSVDELRQEKISLEQRYNDEKLRNKNLEIKLDQETAKFNQSKERNNKMQETVKLAEEKVFQTESQTDRLTEINDTKQKNIASLNDKIKQGMDEQDCNVENFGIRISELTQVFRNAKKIYGKDVLNKEIKEWEQKMNTLVTHVDKKKIELDDITRAFESLAVDTNKFKEMVGKKMGHDGLTCKDLQIVIDQLTEKQQQLNSFLDWIISSENRAKSWIQDGSNITTAGGNIDMSDEALLTSIHDESNISGFGQGAGDLSVSNNKEEMLNLEQANQIDTNVPQDNCQTQSSNPMIVISDESDASHQHTSHQDIENQARINYSRQYVNTSQMEPMYYQQPYCTGTQPSKQCNTNQPVNIQVNHHLESRDRHNQILSERVTNNTPSSSSEMAMTNPQRAPMSQSPFFISLPFSNSR